MFVKFADESSIVPCVVSAIAPVTVIPLDVVSNFLLFCDITQCTILCKLAIVSEII